MALRLIEISVPTDRVDDAREVLASQGFEDIWEIREDDDLSFLRLLVDVEQTGTLTDAIGDQFADDETFRLVILPVEGMMPRREQTAEEGDAQTGDEKSKSGISREELYTDVMDMTKTGGVFIVMTVLSAIVATVGLLRDNVAMIVGAMVIAPLLGPNVALALGTTLADAPLLKHGVRSNFIGFVAAFVPAVLVGVVLTINPEIEQLASRTEVVYSDVALALAAGGAGTLAITTGTAAALVGVMVAVALLPPAVATGLLVGDGEWEAALGAGLLTVTNLICINLASVMTFIFKGVRPLSWYEAERARKATWIAIVLWTVILAILIGLIVYIEQSGAAGGSVMPSELQESPPDDR